jgi:hypothetical protein
MGFILGHSEGRLNRREILRAGIAGLTFQRLASEGSRAYGQSNPIVNICAMGFIGSTDNPLVYYYYGIDCNNPGDYYGITSPDPLADCDGCGDPSTCSCYPDLVRPPPPPPPVSGGKSTPGGMPIPRRYGKHWKDSNNKTVNHCLDYTNKNKLYAQNGLPSIQTTSSGVFNFKFPINPTVKLVSGFPQTFVMQPPGSGKTIPVCLLLFELISDSPKASSLKKGIQFGIGQEVDALATNSSSTSLGFSLADKLSPYYYRGYIRSDSKQQYFHVLTKN